MLSAGDDMKLNQYAVFLPLYSLGGLAFVLNGILPEYELWLSGSMILVLTVGFTLMLAFADWYDSREKQHRQSKIEPFKVRLKRYQDKQCAPRRESTK